MREIDKELLIASRMGDIDQINHLLDQGADIEVKDTAYTQDTPLMWTTYGNHLPATEALLKRGANPNAPDRQGNTPLHWAMQQGHDVIVKILTTYGADKTLKNDNQLTPAEFAYISQKKSITAMASKIGQMEQTIQQLSHRLQQVESNNQVGQNPKSPELTNENNTGTSNKFRLFN